MPRTVLANALLIDGEGPPRPGTTVVIEDERIAAVEGGPVEARTEDRRVDLEGRAVMPGMMTCHYHSSYDDISVLPAPLGLENPPGYLTLVAARNLEKALASGFTSVVSAGGIGDDIDPQCKLAIERGVIDGPRLLAGGRGLDVPGGYSDAEAEVWWWRLRNHGGHRLCSGPEAFREAVREEIRRGVEIIKIFPSGGHGTELPHTGVSLTPEELEAICDTAHRRGALVRAHSPMKDAILACLRAGVDIIDHGDELDEECIELMLANDTALVPSMFFIHRLLEDLENEVGATASQLAPIREGFEQIRKMLPIASQAGVRVLLGDDYGVKILPHGQYGQELAFYVDRVGIAPLDVIRWATRNGAALFGLDRELGVVAPGRLADLLVVDGNPVEEIGLLADRSRILAIVQGGVFYKDELGAGFRAEA